VLRAAYPVLAQWLGDGTFDALARHFWHLHPPQRGDLAQWGHGLDGFVRDNDQLDHRAALADLAQVEWALHAAATAADVASDPASFQRLVEVDPDRLQPVFAAGTALIACSAPVASLIAAHAAADVAAALAELRPRWLAADGAHAETALVWRDGWRPRVRALSAREAPLVEALLAPGATLGQALRRSDPTLDFGAWLQQAVHSGWLCAVRG
jgi:hypothetical protein